MNAPARAERVVLRWARTYTHGLPDAVAARRCAELASDCYEQRHWGHEVGASPMAVATSMVARTLAGLPADLHWRQAQIATARDRSLDTRRRPMGRWLKDYWWVVLAALMGAMEVVLGVGIPFEDRTLGSVLVGIVITALGLTALAGILVRRRHRRAGDVMVAVGMLPVMPFLWTVVLPVLGLIVVVAALVDAADAAWAGPAPTDDRGPGETPASSRQHGGQDRWLVALIGVLAAAVFSAVVNGSAGTAVVLVAPPLTALVTYLAVRPRYAHAPLVVAGFVLLGMAFGSAALTGPVATTFVDDFVVPDALGTAFQALLGASALTGFGLVVAGFHKARDRARPA